MKKIKYIFVIPIVLSISCCVNHKQKDEEQIKDTVSKYWHSVKKNNVKECLSLFEDVENYSGVVQSDVFFLIKNYDKINPNDILLKNIKIKDTVVMFAENKQKYVQYIIKNENDTTYLKKPLIITFMFYKPVGYSKIFNRAVLQNSSSWDK
ncbi:hypothetical protein DBR28_11425 [Chryseobacterium sp. HMWF028]|nr:hypothetical protein DBR28_11425 [Chryseobacterium sp. HMWF028]